MEPTYNSVDSNDSLCGAPCHANLLLCSPMVTRIDAKHRLHFAHSMFNTLATFRSRHDYEALRAAYNSARLVDGSRPAPPFEEWRGISDICDRAGCRYIQWVY